MFELLSSCCPAVVQLFVMDPDSMSTDTMNKYPGDDGGLSCMHFVVSDLLHASSNQRLLLTS